MVFSVLKKISIFLPFLTLFALSFIDISQAQSTSLAPSTSLVGEDNEYVCQTYLNSEGALKVKLERTRDGEKISFKSAKRKIRSKIASIDRRIKKLRRKGLDTSSKVAEKIVLEEKLTDISACKHYGSTGKTAGDQSAQQPNPTPTPTPADIFSPISSPTPTATPVVTPTATPTPSPTRSPTPTPSPTPTVDPCIITGDPLGVTPKIIGGQVCNIGSSPVVYVGLYNNRGYIYSACSGTVVAPPGQTTSRTIILAAHCVQGAYGLAVRINNSWQQATYFASYPFWQANSQLEYGDVAVALFSSNLPRLVSNVLSQNNLKIGEQAVIAGYGEDQFGNASYNQLKAGYVTLSAVTSWGLSIDYFGGAGTNTCFGDSGGPLFVKRGSSWLLAGVTSNGSSPICGPGDRSNFANLAMPDVKAWLNSIVPGLIP